MIPPRLHAVAVAVAAALVLLTNLGGPALWDEDEPKNAACSLAMLERGDWVVPTFNGRLRVEKPALVNWLHLAGFALVGRTETGARLGSAILTTITCLIVWQIARHGCGAPAGLVAGLAMATCVWTAVGGRSATPDAPLVFFTTLSLWCFVMGHRRAGGQLGPGWTSWPWAVSCGTALGGAVLAKGPVGLAIPLLAFTIFTLWQAWDDQASPIPRIPRLWRAVMGLRLPLIAATATAVALPWYTAVTVRTGGAWLNGFLFVHNVGRFQAPMEGHDGSAFVYYPAVLALGFFPWSIVLAAALVHAAAIVGPTAGPVGEPAAARRDAIRLMICWLATWVIAFSSAGTKLPGYIWPAYPALAVITGDLLASWAAGEAICTRWCRVPGAAIDGVMRLAWSILFLAGIGIGIGLALASALGIPALQLLSPIGLIPAAGAVAAWTLQSRGRRQDALGALAISACLVVTLLAAVGSDLVGGARAAQRLVDGLAARPVAGAWAGFGSVPPSVVFYAADTIPQLHSTEAVSAHLEGRPDAHLLVDARFEMNLPSPLPTGYGVIAREHPLFGPGLLVIGPRAAPHEHGDPIAAPHAQSPETPLAWHAPAPTP
ncbi:MAG: glycosyltransferase family 39 protein [Planctomycetota bacterium]|nr:glycosyltransferase family 39 protein [Planctomycetota bacterium]